MRLPRFTLTVCLLATAFLAIPQFSVSTSSTVSAQILDFTNDPPEPELQAADFFVDCDELVAAAEAKENGTIVSGIEVEGSVPESPVPLSPVAEDVLSFFGDDFAINGFSTVESPFAIPSGTLELVDVFGDLEAVTLRYVFYSGS